MVARIAVVAVGVLLAALAAAPAFSQLSRQERQAMMLRGQALNVIQHLGKTDAMYRAALIRSAGLNERYGLPTALGADEIARLYGTGVASPRAVTLLPESGFDWGYVVVGQRACG